MIKKEYSVEVGGKTLTAQFNDWADQANGSVLVRYGNSAVLATVVMGKKESNLDYFPLSVEYEEKFYAAGAILGSRFMRREGRPSEEATLAGRMVDRTIRPLFPSGLKRDVQVVVTVLSIEHEDPDVLAINAASLALATSDVPWNGPVSAVRIGKTKDSSTELPFEGLSQAPQGQSNGGTGNGSFIVNPAYAERTENVSQLDLLACGQNALINMIEVGASEVAEDVLGKAFSLASETIEKVQAWQKEIIKVQGKTKQPFAAPEISAEIKTLFNELLEPKLEALGGTMAKGDITILKHEWIKAATEKLPDAIPSHLDSHFEERLDAWVHQLTIKDGKRVDGRRFDQIRPLFAQAGGISPMIHGTGLFYRGETHVLAALTLGGPGDAQLMDTIEYQDTKKRFMLHYNFPPFSVGETGRMGGANRRMIGHGALAEKALRAVLPPQDTFPYTVRIVSECLASNGSTSMGSVCAGTLSMMDAGVPILRPVAGIAMGMMSDADNKVYKILTDIQGPEDHHGDMDFKVAGTSLGVTAVQMDVKVVGIPVPVLMQVFEQGKKARLEILDVIAKELPAPRPDISPRAPKILTIKVMVDQIGLVIGPGGKMINGIRERTGVDDITIEEDGTVFITGKADTAEAARKEIFDLTREYEVGERFEGEVTRLMDFGAFVKIGPNTEGLVHVSEVAPFRIENISDAVQVGDVVPVLLKEIDDKGRYNLSIKAADPEFAARKGLTPSQGAPRDHGRPGERHGTGRPPRRF